MLEGTICKWKHGVHARGSWIRNNVKVDIVPFEKIEKLDFQLNQKKLVSRGRVIRALGTGLMS